MPTSIILGLASAASAYVAGTAVALAFAKAFIVTLFVQGLSRSLQKSPRTQLDSQGRLITVRQPIAPWEVVLGRARKGGTMTFRYISADRKYWHMVLTLACHPCESIDEVFADGQRIALNSSGYAQGSYAYSASPVDVHDATVPGSPHQVTVPTTVNAIQNVFIDAYGDGTKWGMIDVTPNAPGSFWEFARSGPASSMTFTFHSSAAGKAVSIATYNTNDDSYLRVLFSLGDEGPTVQPFPELVAESGGAWSQEHRQYGHTKVYIRLEANPNVFETGVPNFTFTVRGVKDVYDPRTASTGWTQNAALLTNWYLTNSELGPGFDYEEEVDEADLIEAADDCDDQVTLLTGGTEPRYQANGVFLSSEQPKTVLERLLASCAGSLVDLGDRWRINVGKYHAPTVTLQERDLVGPNVVKPYLETRESANGVKGIFTDAANHWQPNDFPAIEGESYLAEDGGVRVWKTIDLTAFVTSASQSQRLAKIELLRLRQALTEEATFNLNAWGAVPGRTVARTDAQFGWSGKAFEVLDSELAVVEGDGGPVLAVKQVLRETAAAVYDWTTDDETAGELSPNTTLPDAGLVPAPGQPQVSEQLLETRDGRGVQVKVTVSWAASSYPFGANYRLEYKPQGGAAWIVLPLTRGTSFELFDVAPAVYDFRVQALAMSLAASSEYANSMGVEVQGLTTPPSAPTGISIQAGNGAALITIAPSADLDVLRGGRVLVRFCQSGVTPSWESAFSIGRVDGWPGDSVQMHVPLKDGTYLVKFRDSTGQESTTWAEFETKRASALAWSNLDTLTFDPTFTGTHVGTAVVSNELTLGGLGQFDDITDLDAVPNLDEDGGIATDGTFTASTGMDLGAVLNGRIYSVIEGAIDNALDQVDDRTEDVDDWLDFDGSSFGGSAADAWLEMRETDDDPAGSPVWSGWKRLDSAEFSARAFQFRARLTTTDPSYRPLVSALSVTAEEVI